MIMAPQINISEWQLKRLATVYDNQDVASQTIREMASELLSLRQQIAQMQTPAAEPEFCGQIPVDQCRSLELAAWEGDDGNVYTNEEIKSLGDSEDAAIALYPLYRVKLKPAQAVPVGYVHHETARLLKARGSTIIREKCDEFYTVPLYTVPPAIDDETSKMVLELCRLTLMNGAVDGCVTAAMEEMAGQIREKLEADNEQNT